MQQIILTYGVIAGLVIIVSMIIGIEMGQSQAWLGFLIMFIAFSLIYVAIRQYRDRTLGGAIDFTTAIVVGLGVSAVAGVIYVLVWEIYLAVTDYAFIDAYIAAMVANQPLDGASDVQFAEQLQRAEEFSAQYRNALFRLPMTFLEVFPAGLLVTLISGAVLRSK
jgi:hypothetical protein